MTDNRSQEIRVSGGAATFATTHWTRVMAARGDSPKARDALSELCGAYYTPVVSFLRAQTQEEDRARELAHEFFAGLLEKDSISGVDRRRGRFRSYLLGAVKHFVKDVRRKEQAVRRGGGVEHVAIEAGTDTSPGIDPPSPESGTFDREFDKEWAVAILDRALTALKAEHVSEGKAARFETLKPWLAGGTGDSSQAEAAAQLGLNESAVKVAVHRLRRRFRELIKAEIAQTVEGPAAVEQEMRYLLEVLSD